MDYSRYIASIPDYPKKGIIFRDITPLIGEPEPFKASVDELIEFAKSVGAEAVVAPESRGFIWGTVMAYELGIPFVPARKPNKLPRENIVAEYSLEYGTSSLCMHTDAIKPGQKVIIFDDLLATGGTINAVIELVNRLGGVVVGIAVIIELVDLKGRENLIDVPTLSLVQYEGE